MLEFICGHKMFETHPRIPWHRHYHIYASTNTEGKHGKESFCLTSCLTSQSKAKVMSGHCLHFMGPLPKVRMSWHPTSASKLSHKGLYVWMVWFEPLSLGWLKPERYTSNQLVSQKRVSFAWKHIQPIYFFRPHALFGCHFDWIIHQPCEETVAAYDGFAPMQRATNVIFGEW